MAGTQVAWEDVFSVVDLIRPQLIGIVLVKNEDNALPLTDVANLNVFGWASTNPIYSGTGSGTIDVSTAVGILEGLENAGFTLNEELSDMYTEYRADRPIISINDGQDWTLPEVPADQYSEEMLQNAREFSDTALIVISRCGGEGADLPDDMGAVMDGTWQEPGTKYTRASYTNNSDDYDDFTEGMHYLELSRTEQDLVELVCSNFDNVVVVYNGANPLEMGWIDQYEQIKGALICPGMGTTGFNALGSVLRGDVNPSGKTADTWVYDLTTTPYYNNIGHFAYDNVENVTSAALEAWENADGVVSFENYVEGIYVGLRGEWGYEGMVLSDYFGNYGYMDADKAVRGGTDMMLATAGNDAIMTDTTSATSVSAMRQACKNILYTVVNSDAYADLDADATPTWVMTFYVVDAVIAIVLIALEIVLVMRWRAKQKNNGQYVIPRGLSDSPLFSCKTATILFV